MFALAATFFLVFTALYCLASASIYYHLRQYTLPGRPAPKVVLVTFFFLSALFWLFSLTFLFKLPS